jgi:hypothetical protein
MVGCTPTHRPTSSAHQVNFQSPRVLEWCIIDTFHAFLKIKTRFFITLKTRNNVPLSPQGGPYKPHFHRFLGPPSHSPLKFPPFSISFPKFSKYGILAFSCAEKNLKSAHALLAEHTLFWRGCVCVCVCVVCVWVGWLIGQLFSIIGKILSKIDGLRWMKQIAQSLSKSN